MKNKEKLDTLLSLANEIRNTSEEYLKHIEQTFLQEASARIDLEHKIDAIANYLNIEFKPIPRKKRFDDNLLAPLYKITSK